MIILLGRYPRYLFPFQHFEYIMSLPFGLQSFCREDSLVVIPLYLTVLFFCVYNSLSFVILIMICLGVGLFEVTNFEICFAFNIWIFISFLKFGMFTATVSSNTFSNSFSPFLSGTSILQVLAGLMLPQRSQTVFI